MKKVSYLVRVIFALFTMCALIFPLMAAGEGEQEQSRSFVLWTQEGESEGVVNWINDLASRYETQTGISVEVISKDTEALREDFQTASLAGSAPELLWTVNDHAGPFVAAGIIDSVDGLFNKSDFVETVEFNGKAYGVPISTGNHLMLLYNKSLVPNPPETTDELVRIAQNLTRADTYGFVYNQVEPFWLVPWLGGFEGRVFASDGVTPTLDTTAMTETLQFLYDLKFTYQIVPPESDYGTADTLFKEGKAGMIVNGDWSLSDYSSVLGDDLGVAPLPRISKTGSYPAPFTSGKYFMIAENLSDSKKEMIKGFIDFVTSEAVQREMVETFKRLPGLLSSLESSSIQSDPILARSADQVALGTPMPSVIEMRAVWDAMKPEMNSVLAGNTSPRDAASAMQTIAEAGIRALQ